MGENVSLIDGHIDNEIKQTNYERIRNMSVEEMADWLYVNCEWLSAEYGACSGANDYMYLLEFLNSDGEV